MEVALKMAIQSAVRRYDPQPTSAATHARIAPGREAGALGGRPRREWQVLGLQGSYHGDTIGAMDACEPSIYSEHVAWYRGRGQWLAPPTLHTRAGHVEVQVPASLRTHGDAPATATYASLDDVYDVAHRLEHDALAAHYARALHDTLERLVLVEGHRFGALVLEPLVMGAGGMVFVDPLFQRVLIDVVRAREDLFAQRDAPLRTPVPHTPPHTPGAWRGLPVVFDEVFTGLFRLGFASAAEVLGTTPDIACYAKILSGGLVPLSVTLATDDIFATFASSPEKTHALLHGHSYTAHPVGCAVANETLTILDTLHAQGAWQPHQRAWGRAWSFWDRAWVEQLSHHERVASAMALGTVLKIELADAHQGYASNAAESLLAQLRTHGVHLRPLGNVIYVMCSLTTPADVLDAVQTRLLAALS
ncbi:bioDA [Malassezia furfur]|nr:bioDA [Malassezia furfur]